MQKKNNNEANCALEKAVQQEEVLYLPDLNEAGKGVKNGIICLFLHQQGRKIILHHY